MASFSPPHSQCKQGSVFFQSFKHSAVSFGTCLSARSLAQPLGMRAAAVSEEGIDLHRLVCVDWIDCSFQGVEKKGCCYIPS